MDSADGHGRGPNLDDVLDQASRYQVGVAHSGRGHYIAAERAEARGRALGIASAGLSAVVGTSIFASLEGSPSVGWKVAAGLASTVAAVLVALGTFLNYGDRASAHRVAGAAYGRLRREFDRFFLEAKEATDRGEALSSLSGLIARIDELGEASPLLPPGAYRKAARAVKARREDLRREAQALRESRRLERADGATQHDEEITAD